MRIGTVLKLASVGAAVLVLALVTVVKSIDVNQYRDVFAQAARAATGRELTIDGKLSLKLSLTPALIAEDVKLSNASWGSRREMVRLQGMRADIALLPLLVREVRIRSLSLVGPDILLERDAKGQVNWDFTPSLAGGMPSTEGTGTQTTFKIGHVRIDNGRVVYRDAKTGREETLVIDRLTADADNLAAPIGVQSRGAWNGHPIEVSGVLGPLGHLLAIGKPYPVKLKAVLPGLVATANGTVTPTKTGDAVVALQATADATELAVVAKFAGLSLPPLGAARISLQVTGPAGAPALTDIDAALGRHDAVALTAKGSMRSPMTGEGIDLLLFGEGENLAGFNRGLELSLPALAPIKFSAHLTDSDGGWRLADVKALIGRSDLSGDGSLKLVDHRPVVDAHLVSNTIDLDEWLGPNKAEPPKGRAEVGRLFPDDPLPLQALAAADVDLGWKIDRLAGNGLTAQQVDLSLSNKGGKLTFSPNVGGLAGGKVNGTLMIDGAGKSAGEMLTLDADKIFLGDVLKAFNVTQSMEGGRTTVHLSLRATGNSLRAMAAKLSGETLVVTDKGHIDNAYGDAIALDVLRQLAPSTQEKDTQMHCLVSRFAIADGTARSEGLLFDTDYMTVSGQGSVNLANEVIDFTMTPKPKDASLLSLAVPFDVSGTIGHPVVTPNRGAIVKGVASVVGSAALGPLGALVPLVSAGSDEGNPCLAALTPPKKPAPPKKAGKAG